jgi:hypothetical protein
VVRWRALGRARARPGRRRPEAGDERQSREGPRDSDAGFLGPLARTLVVRAGTAARPSIEHWVTNDCL